MKKSVIYLLIILAAGFLFIYIFNPDIEKRCFKVLENEKTDEVTGIIVNKYYDKENMYPYLEICHSPDSSIVKKSFHAELSGIFDYCEIGDSIFKPEGSLKYKIVKDSVVKEFKFTMFCNQ
jgi:hypothetical protein